MAFFENFGWVKEGSKPIIRGRFLMYVGQTRISGSRCLSLCDFPVPHFPNLPSSFSFLRNMDTTEYSVGTFWLTIWPFIFYPLPLHFLNSIASISLLSSPHPISLHFYFISLNNVYYSFKLNYTTTAILLILKFTILVLKNKWVYYSGFQNICF